MRAVTESSLLVLTAALRVMPSGTTLSWLCRRMISSATAGGKIE